MIYDTSNEIQANRVRKRIESLISQKATVELKMKNYRSLSQNNYLHLILGYLSVETGQDMDYVINVYYKQHLNPDIYISKYTNNLTGEEFSTLKSTSDISREQMSESIDRLRNFSTNELDIYLPAPNEDKFLRDIAIEIERNRNYI